MKVMLIDDSGTMRKIQKRTLLGMGMNEDEVKEATNGREAVELAQSCGMTFDVILCDINMPIMNGIATVKALKELPQTREVPIIMCTSVADREHVIEALKAGAQNYLVKPFNPDDLKDKIETTLEKV